MPLRLAFETGALAGIHIVTAAPTIRLGRDPAQNDILLTNPKVSRKHAILEKSVRGGYSLEIQGTGPSKLNGDAIVPVAGRSMVHGITSGDRIDFGGVEFQVCEADVKLIVVSGPAAGRELMLQGPVRIGRGGDCDLVLTDPRIAEEHLVINAAALGFRADARAPAMFNGAQGDSRVLAHGDEIVIGGTTLRFTVTVALDLAEASHAGSSMMMTSAHNAVGELVVIAGAGKNDKIPLSDDQIILGSREDCTYTLGDLLASPLHAAVSKEKDHFVVTDLGSETGTFVNGERIRQGTQLKPGDLIAIGSHVVEARLIGGVSQASRGNTIFTTLPVDQTGPQPRFVLDGRVVKSRKILIGRAPHCDVIVDGAATSREHCVIEWSEGFVIRDTSSHGTYIDDKRIVKQHIPPSAVIRVGNTLFRTTVRGEVCTLERADAALAEAALDVARDKAAQLTSVVRSSAAGLPSNTMLARAGMGPQVGGEALRTIFRMDVGQLEQEIAARKKDKKRGAPAWRPSSDLSGNAGLRGTVVLSVIAAIALCGGALLLGNGRALVNHPLSAAHSSQAFVDKVSGSTVCAGCHTAGDKVDTSRCIACHSGFTARDKHATIDCGGCHREHEGRPATKKGETPHALGAHETCTSNGCHPNQHAKDFAPNQPAVQHIAAGPLPTKHLDTISLHAAHSLVKPPGGKGKPQGINCTACHGSVTAANGPIAQGNPGLACFHCHDGGEKAMTGGCESCHNKEHTAAMARLAPDDPGLVIAAGSPSPFGSLAWALGLTLVGGAPGLLLGAWIRVRRRRSSSKLVEELKAHPAEVVKRLVHSINDSKCVGCGLCVQACPASVLELVEHKSRVVNFDSCIQCKRCENACAFDALRMHDADKPPPMIPMPSIDAFHETPVLGLYLIGQASGTPQVKNATNLGRAVIQRMLQQGVRPGIGRQMGCDVDVVIVGSGPAGLAAALTCVETGMSYVVLEKEREFSWTIRNYYHKGKEVMAEPHDVALESSLPHWDSSREELLGAWQELVDQYRIDIRYSHSCLDIKKNGETFAVSLGDAKGQPMGQVTGARVVLAIGTLGNPRKLGCPGEELEKVKNSLVDPDEWRGKSIMIVGGSDSAVEVVLALCKPELGNRVWFSTRGAKLEGIKPKNMKLIEAALAENKFQMRYATAVGEVTATGIVLTKKEDGSREEFPNDVVFAMIGGNSPQKWLQQLGIPYVDKPHSWSPPRTDHLAQKTAEGLQVQRVPRRPIPERGGHH